MACVAGPREGAADLQEGKKSCDGESKEDNMKCKMQEKKETFWPWENTLLTLLTTSSPLLFFFFF